ncbi:GNAT family N-acetyltransferase [Pseudodesulfovibrio sp.]|nr:GNAT family N-acetyltransferase [Pseudodesulfovibrio sp.]
MPTITLHQYRPGVIDDVVLHHDTYYREHWQFDDRFKAQVTEELTEFIETLDPARDCFWWAASGGDFAGAIAVDGSRSGEGQARIRWFIVPEQFQGDGIGATLFDLAMQHCRSKDFKAVYLWTFEGLGAAKKLYERSGFQLTQTQRGKGWGPEITEQKFEMTP